MYVVNNLVTTLLLLTLFSFNVNAQDPTINLPMLGMNGQLNTYDAKNVNYASELFVDAVNELKLSVIRFPGGTKANSYNWVAYHWNDDGSRTFSINDDELAYAREGSHVGVTTLEEEIGCSPLGSWSSQKALFAEAMIKTNDLLANFKSNILEGTSTKPVYVIRVFDPFYFMGQDVNGNLKKSPIFDLNASGWTPNYISTACGDDVRCTIKRAALAEMRRIFIKLIYEYQDDPQNMALFNNALNNTQLYKKGSGFDLFNVLPIPADQLKVYDEMYFEFGNELYSYVFSKFLPQQDMTVAPCNDIEPTTDAELYAEIVADILPFVKTYFPNAKIGVIAGNRRGCSLWTTRVVEELKAIPAIDNTAISSWDEIDALILHFYPATDSLLNIFDPSVSSLYYYREQLLKLLANEFEENYEDKSVWITELGFPAPEYEEQRPMVGTWYESLMILSLIHEIGLRERFVQDYVDGISSQAKKDALRNSDILPDFYDIDMVLLHTIGVNYEDNELEFQGALRGIDLNGDMKVDEYKLTAIGLAANLYRQFLAPETSSNQLEFKRSLPLLPKGPFIDSLEIVRRCAYPPKPKDMVYFQGVMGMRAYQANQAPNKMQDMFINLTNSSQNVSNWSLPFMSNGSIDHVWTYTAAGLSQDLLLDVGSLRSDLFSVNNDEVLPSASQIGLQVTHATASSSLIMPPRSVMLVSRVLPAGMAVDDHGMSEEAYLKENAPHESTLSSSALRIGEDLIINASSSSSGQYILFDTSGRLIGSSSFHGSFAIPTHDLAAGIYVLKFLEDAKSPYTLSFSIFE